MSLRKGLWFFSILAYAIACKYRLKFNSKNILWLITVPCVVADLRKICQKNKLDVKTNQISMKSNTALELIQTYETKYASNF